MKEDITKSVFDKEKYDVTLNTDLFGQSLRERATVISTISNNISRLYNHCIYKQRLIEIEIKGLKYLAYKHFEGDETFKKANVEIKSMMMECLQLDCNGQKISIVEKEKEYAMYEYLASRGKDKLRELNNNLDLARTFLSWDKQSIDKGV